MSIHVCRTEDLHPYECDGAGKCRHCDKVPFDGHDPATCWLCHNGAPLHECHFVYMEDEDMQESGYFCDFCGEQQPATLAPSAEPGGQE